jgi:hypothetical protein
MTTDKAAQVGRSHDFVAYSYLALPTERRRDHWLTAPTFWEGCGRTVTKKPGTAAARCDGESVYRTR